MAKNYQKPDVMYTQNKRKHCKNCYHSRYVLGKCKLYENIIVTYNVMNIVTLNVTMNIFHIARRIRRCVRTFCAFCIAVKSMKFIQGF